MKILLHVCCAPCGINFFQLSEEDLTFYFYNPHIHPEEEYLKRLESVEFLCERLKIPLIKGEYEKEKWFSLTKGLEKELENGKRCLVCFKMRLEKTALTAKEKNFNAFATTLSLSPYKDVDFINKTGIILQERFCLKYFYFSLDKKERFNLHQKEKELVKRFGLYQQKYCGCLYSFQNQHRIA